MKLFFTEHPRTLNKLSNTLRQAKKVGSNSSLYSITKKDDKIAKRGRGFKGFASSYNVEILNFFKLELQIKDTESENLQLKIN